MARYSEPRDYAYNEGEKAYQDARRRGAGEHLAEQIGKEVEYKIRRPARPMTQAEKEESYRWRRESDGW